MKRQMQLGRLRHSKLRIRQGRTSPVERYFREWLASARHRLLIPLQIVGRTGSTLNVRFVGITPHLRIYLHAWELGVAVIHHQKCWDLIFAIETYPQRRPRGYVCRLCCRHGIGPPKIYSTQASLWRAHSFEPFLNWANEKLYPAKWLCLFSTRGMTSASLLVDEGQVSQCVCNNPAALFREVLSDGSIRMSPDDATIIELLPVNNK